MEKRVLDGKKVGKKDGKKEAQLGEFIKCVSAAIA
jgi:hypothetical protein